MKNQGEKKIKIKTGFIVEKTQQGISIFDPDNSFLFSLNETGTYIFGLIKKNYTVEKIATLVSNEYEIDYNTSVEHVVSFINTLKKYNILTS